MQKYNLESQISDLTVIKDSLLFKVLVKLVAKQERAVKDGSDTFAYSLNEFRLDLQIGKATLVRKFERLAELGYLEVIKNIAVPEGRKQSHYLKTDYKVNLAAINALIQDLAPLSQIERVEHINTMLCVMTPKSLYSIKENSKVKEEPVKQRINKLTKSEIKQTLEKAFSPSVEIKNTIYTDFIKEFPSGTFSKETDNILEGIFNREKLSETLDYLGLDDGWIVLYEHIKDEDLYSKVKDFVYAKCNFSEYFRKHHKMVS